MEQSDSVAPVDTDTHVAEGTSKTMQEPGQAKQVRPIASEKKLEEYFADLSFLYEWIGIKTIRYPS